MGEVKFRKGLDANLPAHAGADELLITTDTGKILLGQGNSLPLKQLGVTTDAFNVVANTYHMNSICRQAITNGNFDIVQRGKSFTNLDSGFSADRWLHAYGADGGIRPNLVISQQTLVAGTIPGSFYFLRFNTDGAGSGFGAGAGYGIYQRIENGTRLLCGAGKKVTVSFYARSSIAGKRIGVSLSQRYGTGGSPGSQEGLYTPGQIIGLTSDWTRYVLTFTTNTLSGKTFGSNNDDYLQLGFGLMWGTAEAVLRYNGGTAEGFGSAGNVDFAQVQLCSGDYAFPYTPKSFREELIDCQRYYEKSYEYSLSPGYNYGLATDITMSITMPMYVSTQSVSTSRKYAQSFFKVPKRTIPTARYWDLGGNILKITTVNPDGNVVSHNVTETYQGITLGNQNTIILQSAANCAGFAAHWDCECEL